MKSSNKSQNDMPMWLAMFHRELEMTHKASSFQGVLMDLKPWAAMSPASGVTDPNENDPRFGGRRKSRWRNKFALVLREMVTKTCWFECLSLGITALAAGYTGWQLDSGLEVEKSGFDDVFMYFFALEFILKVVDEGDSPSRYFTDSDEGVFNCVDAAVVAMSVIGTSWCVTLWGGNERGGGSGLLRRFAVARAARLCRLVRLAQSLPHPYSLAVHGLAEGAASAACAFVLLLVLILAAAVLCVAMFGSNDPSSFGDLGVSMVSLFRVALLTSWSPLAYTAIFGCDEYGGEAGYFQYGNTDNDNGAATADATTEEATAAVGEESKRGEVVHASLGGALELWSCDHPAKQLPGAAEAFFVLFTMLSSFVLVGLITASIAFSVGACHHHHHHRHWHRSSLRGGGAATKEAEEKKSFLLSKSSALGRNVEMILSDTPVDRAALHWDLTDEDGNWRWGQVSLPWLCFRLETWPPFHYAVALAMVADVIAAGFAMGGNGNGGNNNNNNDDDDDDGGTSTTTATASLSSPVNEKKKTEVHLAVVHVAVLAVLSIDVLVRVGARRAVLVTPSDVASIVVVNGGEGGQGERVKGGRGGVVAGCVSHWAIAWRRYLSNPWNVFDAAVVAASALQLLLIHYPFFNVALHTLRALRLVRAFRTVSPRLRCLVNALSKGLAPSLGVLVQLSVLNYALACVGVLSFGGNDPFHFGTLKRAALSVWRIETGDNWDEILAINMYGCAAAGLTTSASDSSALLYCDEDLSVASGYWAVAFVLVGVVLGGLLAPGVVVGVLGAGFCAAWGEFSEEKLACAAVAAIEESFLATGGGRGSGEDDDDDDDDAEEEEEEAHQQSRRKALSNAVWWDEERLALIKQTFAMLDYSGEGMLAACEAEAFFNFVSSHYLAPLANDEGARGGNEDGDGFDEEKEEEEEEEVGEEEEMDEAAVLPAERHPAVLSRALSKEQVLMLRRRYQISTTGLAGMDKAAFRDAARLALKDVKKQGQSSAGNQAPTKKLELQREFPLCERTHSVKDLDAAFEVAAALEAQRQRHGQRLTGQQQQDLRFESIGQELFVVLCWRCLEGGVCGVSAVRGAEGHARSRRGSLDKWIGDLARKEEEGGGGEEEEEEEADGSSTSHGGVDTDSKNSAAAAEKKKATLVVPAAYHPAVLSGALSASQVEALRTRFHQAAAAAARHGGGEGGGGDGNESTSRRGSAFEKNAGLGKVEFKKLLRRLFDESGEEPLKLLPNSDLDTAFELGATTAATPATSTATATASRAFIQQHHHSQATAASGSSSDPRANSNAAGRHIEQEAFLAVYWRALEGDVVGVGGAQEAKEKVKRIQTCLSQAAVGTSAPNIKKKPKKKEPKQASTKNEWLFAQGSVSSLFPLGAVGLGGQDKVWCGGGGRQEADRRVSLSAFVAFFLHARKVRRKLLLPSFTSKSAQPSRLPAEEERRHKRCSGRGGGGASVGRHVEAAREFGEEVKDEAHLSLHEAEGGAGHETESHKQAKEAQHGLDRALSRTQSAFETQAQNNGSATSSSSSSSSAAAVADEAAVAAATALLAVEVAKATAIRDEAVAVDKACCEAWALVLSGMENDQEEWEKGVEKMFTAMDKDGSGEIDVDELGAGLQMMVGVRLSPAQLQAFRENVDEDEDGRISRSEFLAAARWEQRKVEKQRTGTGCTPSQATPPTLQQTTQQQTTQQTTLQQTTKAQRAQPQQLQPQLKQQSPSQPLFEFEADAAALLVNAGLMDDFAATLQAAGFSTFAKLDAADDAALLACGFRRMHVKKLRFAAFAVRSSGGGGGGGGGYSGGRVKPQQRVQAEKADTRGRIRADAGLKFQTKKGGSSSANAHPSNNKQPPQEHGTSTHTTGPASSRLTLKPGPAGAHNKAVSAAGRVAEEKQRKAEAAAAREERRRVASTKVVAQRQPSRARPNPAENTLGDAGGLLLQRQPSPSDYALRGTHL